MQKTRKRRQKPKGVTKLWWKIQKLFREIPKRISAPWITWKKISADFEKYLLGSESGVTTNKRNPKVILSLTSFPPRIPRIQYTIYSLLKQTVKPDEILLWLAEEQFPNRNGDLPETLLKLVDHGLTIRYCKDIKSYKKLIPALREYPHDIIVTLDDDVYYQSDMLELLLLSHEKNKNAVHGHCGHIILFDGNDQLASYLDWKKRVSFREVTPSFGVLLTGVGGILYPPNVLYRDVLREDLFLKLSPTADDVWFWAMAVLNDTRLCIVENNTLHPKRNSSGKDRSPTGHRSLAAINCNEGGNDKQIRQVLEHYPAILEKLKTELP
ncbi:MAG: glycosyltransferase family 2 protein [Planctomycetaceae bacterium]|nr:glycosyltransferase family 2 protein [Planctomycetaceae bacterium]